MTSISFSTPRTARYQLLGEPGPSIAHVWVCLHGHRHLVADMAKQLAALASPERLLVLPEALSRYELQAPDNDMPGTGAAWFAPDSLLADLTDVGVYLDGLTQQVLASCVPSTPLTVLGYGHGAAAACRWLAGNGVDYERLVLWDAAFPAIIDRRATLVALPERPVLVLSSANAPQACSEDLLQDLLDVGLRAEHQRVEVGPLPLAALAVSAKG